ncbi:hypothetical protein AVEN_172303-1 [Araneus ventricosus]|uniref:Uncharacterized protein n=1 Tax=Araneus ventricosus TaxID=182803 RepID=A0A4Y2E1E1_ARAVE|nr:hypothetical protein AVEN_172303-1 [Araneus ventricosus]
MTDFMKRKRRKHETAARKSMSVQAPEALHVSLGSPAVDIVADRHFAGVGTCASSISSLHATNGMWSTGFKTIDTKRCVFKGPKTIEVDQHHQRRSNMFQDDSPPANRARRYL